MGIDMPITEVVYQILFEGLPAAEGLHRLMTRQPTSESGTTGTVDARPEREGRCLYETTRCGSSDPGTQRRAGGNFSGKSRNPSLPPPPAPWVQADEGMSVRRPGRTEVNGPRAAACS